MAYFNMGSGTAIMIIKELGLEAGYYSQAGTRKADEQRDLRAKVVLKKQRKVLRGQKKKKKRKTKEKEGNTYEAF